MVLYDLMQLPGKIKLVRMRHDITCVVCEDEFW